MWDLSKVCLLQRLGDSDQAHQAMMDAQHLYEDGLRILA